MTEVGVHVRTPDGHFQGYLLIDQSAIQLSWSDHNNLRVTRIEDQIKAGNFIGFELAYVFQQAVPEFLPNNEAERKIDILAGALGLKKGTVADLMGNEWSCNFMPDGSVNFRKGK